MTAIQVLTWIQEERARLNLSVVRLQRAGREIQAAHQRGRAAALQDVAEQFEQPIVDHFSQAGTAAACAAAQRFAKLSGASNREVW